MQARRQHLVVETHDGLEQASGTSGGLQVPDVGLHGAQRDAPGGQPEGTEDLVQRAEFGGIPDPGGGAVRLEHSDGTRVDAGVLPRPGDRELLPDRVRRGDALALAVRRAADAEDDRVHVVAGLLRIREPFQDEQGTALAHHETVGAGVEGPGSGCRQRTDLAEPHEGAGLHVVVDTAADARVVVMGL